MSLKEINIGLGFTNYTDWSSSFVQLKEWTQVDLANVTGISQANISAIENDRVEIGKQRAITIAEALNVRPASIMFADNPESA